MLHIKMHQCRHVNKAGLVCHGKHASVDNPRLLHAARLSQACKAWVMQQLQENPNISPKDVIRSECLLYCLLLCVVSRCCAFQTV
jgi:hypothetical protein